MVFAEDKLHCDIFALVLFIQLIFVRSCKLVDISHAYIFSSIVGIILGPSIFGVLRF